MAIKKLDSIFKPKRIALIGVSNNPDSVGGITLRNLVGGGYNGVVYPVNPKREAVFGIPCYPDVKSLPKIPDFVLGHATSARQQVLAILRQTVTIGRSQAHAGNHYPLIVWPLGSHVAFLGEVQTY